MQAGISDICILRWRRPHAKVDAVAGELSGRKGHVPGPVAGGFGFVVHLACPAL